MKSIFRYLNAEFNGFFVTAYHRALEGLTGDMKELFSYMRKVQLKLESEDIGSGEVPISEEDLKGIGTIAGLFVPFISAESNVGSLVFTKETTVNGNNYAERGLFDMNGETFKYVRTDAGAYQSDITSLAGERLRASFVPDGAPILGYIADGTVAFTEDGRIIPEAILASPPADKAYVPYYGEKYLFLAETFLIKSYIDIETYKNLLLSLQRIRYGGSSLAELVYLTELLLEDYLYDISFESYARSVKMKYKINEESEISGKVKKLYVWKHIVEMKFKQIYAVEEIVQ